MGNPVALDASAELRETRGFISMMTMRPLSGLTANWMFEPPVSTPTARITAKLASRMIWYSLSVRVWIGATVIESPVCTPIGSKFSMEQMMTQLSAWSRMTSISYSFHPSRDSSTRISDTGDKSRPRLVHGVGGAADRHVEPDADHELLESLAVLASMNGLSLGPDHFHVVALE